MSSESFDAHPEVICSDSIEELKKAFIEKSVAASENSGAIPVLTGPTASGKSSLAMALAAAHGFDLVSADAMQIYRGFDIGTAKPSMADRTRVPHHMIDILDACEGYSVAAYTEEASALLEKLLNEDRRPLVCGGSVQYVSSLLDGLAFMPDRPDPALRLEILREIDAIGCESAWEKMHALDPGAAAATAPTDRRRIARFFEIYRSTGQTKSERNRLSRLGGPRFRFIGFHLDIEPRNELYERINQRASRMFAEGLVDETRLLMEKYPNYSDCPAFRGIGYRESVQAVLGVMTPEEACDAVSRATRHYAKRQQTWLRRRNDLIRLVRTA